MKRLLCLLLAVFLLCGCSLLGEEPYVPSGDALIQDDDPTPPPPAPDTHPDLTPFYYADKANNPLPFHH